MDKILYGGFSRGELNIFAGGSGSGKELGHDEHSPELVAGWTQSGVYISLELSEELCASED
jgi:KaiC/GvpD/RAD55 family RecA-like ATPase